MLARWLTIALVPLNWLGQCIVLKMPEVIQSIWRANVTNASGRLLYQSKNLSSAALSSVNSASILPSVTARLMHSLICSSRINRATRSRPPRTAATWTRTSGQGLPSFTMVLIPRTWPSIRDKRLTICLRESGLWGWLWPLLGDWEMASEEVLKGCS